MKVRTVERFCSACKEQKACAIGYWNDGTGYLVCTACGTLVEKRYAETNRVQVCQAVCRVRTQDGSHM